MTSESKKKHNLKYEDIEDIVEYLVKTKAYGYAFDCYSTDDIAQEIRIICLTKLESLTPKRLSQISGKISLVVAWIMA